MAARSELPVHGPSVQASALSAPGRGPRRSRRDPGCQPGSRRGPGRGTATQPSRSRSPRAPLHLHPVRHHPTATRLTVHGTGTAPASAIAWGCRANATVRVDFPASGWLVTTEGAARSAIIDDKHTGSLYRYVRDGSRSPAHSTPNEVTMPGPTCPACGKTEALHGRPSGEDIAITCGQCGAEWMRGEPRCKQCGRTG